jgi:hypothetical protein
MSSVSNLIHRKVNGQRASPIHHLTRDRTSRMQANGFSSPLLHLSAGLLSSFVNARKDLRQ